MCMSNYESNKTQTFFHSHQVRFLTVQVQEITADRKQLEETGQSGQSGKSTFRATGSQEISEQPPQQVAALKPGPGPQQSRVLYKASRGNPQGASELGKKQEKTGLLK